MLPATPAPAQAGDPATTVENVIQACREKDGGRLRTFIANDVSEADIQALFARGTDVRLVGRAPAAIEADAAAVDVRLEITREGKTETVDDIWDLELGADGVWRLVGLPDCF
ncbi:MAG: hypothetical protein WBD55_00945 [Dehalococcoidia bacterium]